MRADAAATIPSYCTHGQLPFAAPAQTGIQSAAYCAIARHKGCPGVAEIWSNDAILHCTTGIYAIIANYLQLELRYMDAGDEAQQRQQGQ
jgi:hypothetical protein